MRLFEGQRSCSRLSEPDMRQTGRKYEEYGPRRAKSCVRLVSTPALGARRSKRRLRNAEASAPRRALRRAGISQEGWERTCGNAATGARINPCESSFAAHTGHWPGSPLPQRGFPVPDLHGNVQHSPGRQGQQCGQSALSPQLLLCQVPLLGLSTTREHLRSFVVSLLSVCSAFIYAHEVISNEEKPSYPPISVCPSESH